MCAYARNVAVLDLSLNSTVFYILLVKMTKNCVYVLFPPISTAENSNGDRFAVATLEINENKSTEVEQQPKLRTEVTSFPASQVHMSRLLR